MENLAVETVLQLVIGMELFKLSGFISLSLTDSNVYFTPKGANCAGGEGGGGGGGWAPLLCGNDSFIYLYY